MKSLQTNSPLLPGFSAPGFRLTSLPVAARLRIAYGQATTGFAFEPEGEFPRRVRQGEALARAAGFPLLAPRSGPVELDTENESFELRVEGALKIGRGGERETLRRVAAAEAGEKGFRLFLDQLREAGIPSLDFDGRPLYRLFERACESERPVLIISTKDPEAAVVWEKLIGDGFDEMAGLLEKILGGRGAVLLRRYGGRGLLGLEPLERYGRHLPPLIARACLPAQVRVDYARPLEEQGIVFLGPATLYALQNWLLHDRPFFSRPVALRTDPGNLFAFARRRSRLHELPNGYPLKEFFGQLRQPQATGVIAGDFLRQRDAVTSAAELENLNVFRHSAFYLSRRHRRRYDLNLPCTGCMACQRLCPTGADPLALVEGRERLFDAAACIECGICTYACESAIPIDAAIRRHKSDEDSAA